MVYFSYLLLLEAHFDSVLYRFNSAGGLFIPNELESICQVNKNKKNKNTNHSYKAKGEIRIKCILPIQNNYR